jgi:Fe2+ transport system protein FeoA
VPALGGELDAAARRDLQRLERAHLRDPVRLDGRSLAEAEPGEDLCLIAFDEDDPEILGWLHREGLAAGSIVHVVDVAPHHSTTTIAFDGGSVVIGRTIAGAVRIAATGSAR